MATYRLFPSTNGPASAVTYTGNFISGIVFAVKGGGNWFQGYWFWVANNAATTPVKCALWSVTSLNTGVVVPGSVVTSGTLTTGAWNFVPVATPLQLAPSYDGNFSTASSAYIAAIGVNGNFSDTNSMFNTGDTYAAGITNGPLVAFSGKTGSKVPPWTLAQGVFTTTGSDPSVTMPNTQDSGGDGASNFWIDLQITDQAPNGYAGTYRLWPNKYDTNPASGTDSAIDYLIATEIHLSTAVSLNYIWYYSPSGTAQLATWAGIYQITGVNSGTLVASNTSPTWLSPSGGTGTAGSGWVKCAISGTLPAGSYKVGVYNNAASPDAWGPKDATTAYFDLGVAANGITWGPVSAPNLSSASQAYNYGGPNTATPPYSNGTISVGQPTFAQPAPSLTLPVYPYLYAPVTADTDSSNAIHTQNYWVDLEVTGPVNVSVSDYAGAVDSEALTINISVADFAGEVEADVTNIFILVNDYAGAVETHSGATVTLSFADYAGAADIDHGRNANLLLNTLAVIAVNAFTTLNASFTSQVAVGAPYQGNMAQLALDRWNYMYPS